MLLLNKKLSYLYYIVSALVFVAIVFGVQYDLPLQAASNSDADQDGVSDDVDIDDDADGYPDFIELETYRLDHDNDGTKDTNDTDDDNDGKLDSNEKSQAYAYDADNDGTGDKSENPKKLDDKSDADRDGVPDSIEQKKYRNNTDNDKKKNDDDKDDDADGLKDKNESDSKRYDTDNDGKSNRKDTDDDADGVKDWNESTSVALLDYYNRVPCSSCAFDFALYDPSYEDDGVWEEEVTALKAMFDTYGWSYEVISYTDINTGKLGSGDSRRYRAVIAPGGYSYYRELVLSTTGETNLRNFISSGGSFIGFCAGTYWTGSLVTFATDSSGGNGTYNLESDYISYPWTYHLKIFPGETKGPFGWTPWANGSNINFELADITTGDYTMKKIGLPAITRFLYGGGPVFLDGDTDSNNYHVWARAQQPSNAASGADFGDGDPAIVHYTYGGGQVVLFAYHPDVLIDNNSDNVTLSQFYQEDEIDWNTGDQTKAEINLDSWNIVHAAMQIAAEEPVTPLQSLPQ